MNCGIHSVNVSELSLSAGAGAFKENQTVGEADGIVLRFF